MSTDAIEVRVPDIGDYKDVAVLEVLVKPGDAVAKDGPIVVLESDKATLDIPAPQAGVVQAVHLRVGDKVSKGALILSLERAAAAEEANGRQATGDRQPATTEEANRRQATGDRQPATVSEVRGLPAATAAPSLAPAVAAAVDGRTAVRASPSLRKLGRELGVDLARVQPSGPAGRLRREDLEAYVRAQLQPGAPSSGAAEARPAPAIDFGKFGPVERRALSRVQRLSGANLSRNWATIPHVTSFDEADITGLEAFRVQLNRELDQDQERRGTKVTLLAFVLKACARVLERHPQVNASLDGDELVYKRYFHLGFAADTPNGLVVPVIRDVDRKGVLEIAREAAELAARARAGKLSPAEMQGGCFTVSSLGGVGGTGFTPIINAPEVAILGVTRAQTKPVWDGSQFQPRLVLPLMLSWDHRVLDGVAAARFLVDLAALLADLRRALL